MNKPDWLKVRLPKGEKYNRIKDLLRKSSLHTVCEEAGCPNIGECFSKGTATFLILGDTCTRNCLYCNVKQGIPKKVDKNEAKEVARTIQLLKLSHAVITSVTRDDLEDGGANVFSECIKEIKKKDCKVEVLIPDFKGNLKSIKKIINANPDIINHNIEVVKKIFKKVRPKGKYDLSISLLKNIKQINPAIKTKSGLMVGFEETHEQIIETLKDLKKANVNIITIGQYLQPNKKCLPVKKYYTPEEFNDIKERALELGFEKVVCGPLVRSSYHAEEYA